MAKGQEKTSVIEWNGLDKRPDDASYVIIKMIEPEGKQIICIPACYEDGRFLDVLTRHDNEISKERIAGWSYYPYDDRLHLN